VKTKAYQITTLKKASIAILAATWVLSFAVLGGPVPQKQTDDGSVSPSGQLSTSLTEGQFLQQARHDTPSTATQLGSIVGIWSMMTTGLAVGALVIPFGLSSISLLRRNSTLESRRVGCLAQRVSDQKEEQGDPAEQKPVLAGVE